MDEIIKLFTRGELQLKTTNPKLAELEAFCAKARELGLPDNTAVHTLRQGLMGPVVGWHIDVPTEPKKMNT